MVTTEISEQAMQARVSRFAALKPLPAAQSLNMPQAAKDLIYSRKLLSVVGLDGDGDTPINQGAAIRGAGGITMTHAVCPPGTGPALHSHLKTYETFTVLQGVFEVCWNDTGNCRVELGRFDTISVPPGVCRSFRNISDEEGIVQVIISGGVHDMADIDFTPTVASELATYGDDVLAQFRSRGLTFTAGEAGP